jgi:hypothetical protein
MGFIVARDVYTGELWVLDREGQGWNTNQIGWNPEWLDEKTIMFDFNGKTFSMTSHGENVFEMTPGYRARQANEKEFVFSSVSSPNMALSFDVDLNDIINSIPETNDMAIKRGADEFVSVYQGQVYFGNDWRVNERIKLTHDANIYSDLDW